MRNFYAKTLFSLICCLSFASPNLPAVEDILFEARTYQDLGHISQAIAILEQQLPALAEPQQRAMAYAVLSDLYLSSHKYLIARQYIDSAVEILDTQTMSPEILAMVFNNLGNILSVEAYFAEAISIYRQALTHAETPYNIKIKLNLIRTQIKNQQFADAIEYLQQAYSLLTKQQSSPNEQAFLLITVGELAQLLHNKLREINNEINKNKIDLRLLAHDSLNMAIEMASPASRVISYAYGYLGQLYESEQRYDYSLSLTRRAIFAAQASAADEVLYRWEWQLGRLFKQQQQPTEAIQAYRRAVNYLHNVRLGAHYRKTSLPFRETAGLVYFELADLLLQQAAVNGDSKWLIEARDTIELFKTVELQDYFQDDCLDAAAEVDFTAPDKNLKTAVYYPILLADRLEIILSLDADIYRFAVEVSAQSLKDETNEFRFELETRESNAYLKQAYTLHQWLIAPIADLLHQHEVKLLVVVADGVLRTIPFAALHDKTNFLIQNYAVATVPSLTLTDPRQANKVNDKILINGLSRAVQGFPQLSSVTREVNFIQRLYGNQAKVLLDQNFTSENFTQALRNTPYSVIHIASHALFNSNPQKTFLLTYDGKITMNIMEDLMRLSRVRNEPVELLTLSACQTAVGDDQAALGLAGIAIKAGARAALASLWSIDDVATAILINQFYEYLQQEKLPKAIALQQAQQHLITKTRYQHPAFWAAFLLIGNWL